MAHVQNLSTGRFLDAAGESELCKVPSPMDGYEQKPLVSLEEAVRSLNEVCENIQAYVRTATTNCQNPQDTLTPDESAAIYLYTMDCVYKPMNAALRNENRRELVPYFSYLKLLLTALWKLDDVNDVIWRGVKENIDDDYKTGKKFFWWGLTSCTTSLEILQSDTFLGDTGHRILFAIQCFNGKNIHNHSQFSQENEVLLLPCSYFEVMGSVVQGNGLHIIHLKQIDPPVILLPPPCKIVTHSRLSKTSITTPSSTNTITENDVEKNHATTIETSNLIQHLSELPEFWGTKTYKDGICLFYDHLDGRTTPTDPRFCSEQEVSVRIADEVERLEKHKPLPNGWKAQITDDGRMYFIDSKKNIRSWTHLYETKLSEKHAPLPSGWEMRTLPDGRHFYIDHVNKRTTWLHPLNETESLYNSNLK